jgi:hypothetical protein
MFFGQPILLTTCQSVDQNVDQRVNVSCGLVKRIGTLQAQLWNIKGLYEPIGTHGDQLKNRWVKARVSSTLTFGTTFLV